MQQPSSLPGAPRVSVLLPVRDGALTLPRALASILDFQNQEPAGPLHEGFLELLAVDDGSCDATPAILAEASARDPRVRVLTLPPSGIVSALNAGLAAARGAYVARMDADDEMLPGRLAAQAGYLDAHTEIGLVACRVRFGGCRRSCRGMAAYVDWINTLLTPEAIALHRFVESPLAHPSVMFRSELVERHGPYADGEFPEDYELWLRWLEAGVGMAKLPDELLVWHDPPERLSRTHPRYSVNAFYRVKGRYLARWLAAHNPHHPAVWLIGAGRTARLRARSLVEQGIEIAGYVDIDPRKVGRQVHGLPVVHRDELPAPGSRFYLSYVGSRGAREEIADFLTSRGHVPGRDFLLAA